MLGVLMVRGSSFQDVLLSKKNKVLVFFCFVINLASNKWYKALRIAHLVETFDFDLSLPLSTWRIFYKFQESDAQNLLTPSK